MAITARISGNGNGRSNGNGNGYSNGNAHVAVREETSPGTAVPGLSGGVSGEGEKVAEGRDEGGRFAAGNKGGPGNPYNRRVAMFKIWLTEVVDEEGVKKVGRALLAKAGEGDVAAARVLFQYVMPKSVEPDRMNVEEWRLLKEDGMVFGELPGMMTKPGAELALQMVRAARPMATEKVAGMTMNLLLTPQEKIGDVSEMLVADREGAREYLETGKSPRTAVRGLSGTGKKGKGKRGKR